MATSRLPFPDLPEEIRLMIYQYMLEDFAEWTSLYSLGIESSPYAWDWVSKRPEKLPEGVTSVLNLMSLNEIVHEEVKARIFEQATFKNYVSRIPHKWFDAGPHAGAKLSAQLRTAHSSGFCFALRDMQKFHLTLGIFSPIPSEWYENRHAPHIGCTLLGCPEAGTIFDEMVNLKELTISAYTYGGGARPKASCATDILTWIIKRVPRSVTIKYAKAHCHKSVSTIKPKRLHAYGDTLKDVQGTESRLVKP